MRDNTFVYLYSQYAAKKDNELTQYQESYALNVECAKAIEKAIEKTFDGKQGYRLTDESAKEVISEFGVDRVNYVLSNTLQRLNSDGRFSRENKEWAKSTHIPVDVYKAGYPDRRNDFIVSSHCAVLDGFIRLARKEYQSLGLWEVKHCNSPDHLDFEGKIMVLHPSNLIDQYKTPRDQLVYTKSGFGCSPTATGRKVSGVFISDGEQSQHIRNDFIGELKEEHHSQWLKERLKQMDIEYVSLETKENQLLELIKESFTEEETENFNAITYERYGLTTATEINLALAIKQGYYTIYREMEDCAQVGERYISEEYPALDEIIQDNLDFDGIGMNLEEQGGKFVDNLFVLDYDNSPELIYKPSEIDSMLREYQPKLEQGQSPTM